MITRLAFLFCLAAAAGCAQTIRIVPQYLGQPLPAANANYATFYLTNSDTFGQAIWPNRPTPTIFSFPGVNTTLRLRRANDVGDGAPPFVSATLTHPDSGSIDWTPEIGGHYGILKGSVRIDGNVPAAGTTRIVQEKLNQYGLELDTVVDAAGNFRLLLAVATYNFTIRYNSNTVLTTSFTILPGQEVDAGTILAPSVLANGTLRTEPYYLGQPLNTLNADFRMDYWRNNVFRSTTFARIHPVITDSLPPSSYTVDARVSGVVMGTANATVVSSTTVNAYPEVGGAMGIVQGAVTVNGLPPATGSSYSLTSTAGVTTNLSTSAGVFRQLLRAGTYTGSVTGTAGAFYTFPFTVAAGQTTNLGTLATTESIGTLVINPVYFGQPISTLGAGFYFRARVTGLPLGGNLVPATPTWTGNLLAGTYTIVISQGPSDSPLLTGTVNVAPNTTTNYQPELSTVAGLFRGGLRLEGNPPTTAYNILTGGMSFPVSLATGDFRGLIWGGTHSFSVAGAAPFFVGTLPIPNGVETDLGLLGLLNFNPTITSAGGGPFGGVRTWNFRLQNNGPAAVNARITAVDAFPIGSSPACAFLIPTLQTTLPVLYGSIAPATNVTRGITHDFQGASSGCLYRIRFTVTDGAARQVEFFRTNIFQ